MEGSTEYPILNIQRVNIKGKILILPLHLNDSQYNLSTEDIWVALWPLLNRHVCFDLNIEECKHTNEINKVHLHIYKFKMKWLDSSYMYQHRKIVCDHWFLCAIFFPCNFCTILKYTLKQLLQSYDFWFINNGPLVELSNQLSINRVVTCIRCFLSKVSNKAATETFV